MNPELLTAPIGQVFSGPPRRLSMARALALSGGPFDASGWPEKNLHTDLRAANEAGLATVIGSGTQFEGYLVSLLVDLFDTAWLRGGELDVKITRSVRIGETLRACARLDGLERGTDLRFALAVWCENQDGDQVLVGTAVCAVPRPAG
jgi:acyl dehydratase